MTKHGTQKRIVAALMAWILIAVFMPVLSVHAANEETDYIRVGLTDNFSKRDSLTIKNSNLYLGYCVNNVYSKEATIRTENGITITPDTGTYKIYKKTFNSYSKAVSEAASVSALNKVSAYACSCGQGNWLVYVASTGGLSHSYLLRVSTGKGSFLIDGLTAGSFPQFEGVDGENVHLSNIFSYKGRIEVGRYGGANNLSTVNVLPLEEYVKGVVTNEMLSNWPAEALKAQAVCARSYAITTAGLGSSGNIKKGYKMGDTALYQVYKGANFESESGNKAVIDTTGEVILYDNKVIKAYYFSTSGGATESAEDVWNKGINYLQSVPDLYETEPELKPWAVTLTASQIENKLNKNGNNIGNLTDIIVTCRSKSGHVYALKFKGTNGDVTVEKEKIRTLLGLDSNKFKVIGFGSNPDRVYVKSATETGQTDISDSYILNGNYQIKKADNLAQYQVMSADNISGFASKGPASKGSYMFVGSGYGHGIGMSQSGAKGMAKAGFTYKEIIEHYYTGCYVN